MKSKLYVVTKKPQQCDACPKTISFGERYAVYQRPAQTSYERIHSGHMVQLRRCEACATAIGIKFPAAA